MNTCIRARPSISSTCPITCTPRLKSPHIEAREQVKGSPRATLVFMKYLYPPAPQHTHMRTPPHILSFIIQNTSHFCLTAEIQRRTVSTGIPPLPAITAFNLHLSRPRVQNPPVFLARRCTGSHPGTDPNKISVSVQTKADRSVWGIYVHLDQGHCVVCS